MEPVGKRKSTVTWLEAGLFALIALLVVTMAISVLR